MSGQINSHICLMLSVYESLHQMVKYGRQISYILQYILNWAWNVNFYEGQ